MYCSLHLLEVWILSELVWVHVYEGWLGTWELRHKQSPTMLIHACMWAWKKVFWRESCGHAFIMDNWKTLEKISLHKYIILGDHERLLSMITLVASGFSYNLVMHSNECQWSCQVLPLLSRSDKHAFGFTGVERHICDFV